MALLFHQGDELLFGADVAVDQLIGVVKVADDGGLLVQWRNGDNEGFELFLRKVGDCRFVVESVEPSRTCDAVHDSEQVWVERTVFGSDSVECVLKDEPFWWVVDDGCSSAFPTLANE